MPALNCASTGTPGVLFLYSSNGYCDISDWNIQLSRVGGRDAQIGLANRGTLAATIDRLIQNGNTPADGDSAFPIAPNKE